MKKLPDQKNSVEAFLAETKKHPVVTQKKARLVFAMDATASREHTWDLATSLHGELFRTAKEKQLSVQLVYYRGFNEFNASNWTNSSNALLNSMQNVRCIAGGTQIARVLSHIRKESLSSELKAAVLVGDACEENPFELYELAGQLGLFRVPVFVFQEGNDQRAAQVFSRIAQRSGGAHIPFRAGSASDLAELLGAVASYATGGREAIQKLKGNLATRLLTQVKR
ncbi:MAG: VWA domain-containing protein [Gammaproteobacteria bacterium]|nr:VWA domain-containing protein [Gammaproteobacteria bacterium]